MKITINQLRRIIKEEVEQALQHEAVKDHERPDEALVNLSLGMEKWLTPDGISEGWDQITAALQSLVTVAGMTEEDINEEISRIAEELGYGEDDMMDLDVSVSRWMSTH